MSSEEQRLPGEDSQNAGEDGASSQDALRNLEREVTLERAREKEREKEKASIAAKPAASDKPKVTVMRRRTSGLVALALVLFAFLAGLFAWPFILPHLQAYLPEGMRVMPVANVADTAVIDTLSKRIDALEAKLAALPPAASAQDLAALKATLDQQDAKMADLAQRLDLAQNDERFTDLMKTHEDLANSIRMTEARLAKLEAVSPVGQRATLLALAATRLRLRAETARPFADDLALVERLADDVGGLDAAGMKALNDLGPHAEAGAPSLRDLVSEFPEAAHRAMKASEIPVGAVWWRVALARIEALITVRHTGRLTGNSVEARLSRAEARLGANDLAGAVTEVEALDGRAADKIDPWLQSAYARLAIDRAARALEAAAYRIGEAAPQQAQTPVPSGVVTEAK